MREFATSGPAFDWMLKAKEQLYETEAYVSVPPALIITDARGDVWTLGFQYGPAPRGEFAFQVLRNGHLVGEFASRIEYRRGQIKIFTERGYKCWNGRSFT